jgi:hypothetical protein
MNHCPECFAPLHFDMDFCNHCKSLVAAPAPFPCGPCPELPFCPGLDDCAMEALQRDHQDTLASVRETW